MPSKELGILYGHMYVCVLSMKSEENCQNLLLELLKASVSVFMKWVNPLLQCFAARVRHYKL